MIMRDKLILSTHIGIYDLIIPKGHLFRQINDLVDFSFVDKMLSYKYTLDQGKSGYRPQKMFKYLLLKNMFELFDRDLVSLTMTDMAFKSFLGLALEDEVIEASSLTKFRRLHYADSHSFKRNQLDRQKSIYLLSNNRDNILKGKGISRSIGYIIKE